MRTFVSAKLHGIVVTDKSVEYHGSVSINGAILSAAQIEPYERVDVVNLNNGERWTTYAVPTDDEGAFTLNGGGARKGEVGDACVVMTYRDEDVFSGARVIYCYGETCVDGALRNEIVDSGFYEPHPDASPLTVALRRSNIAAYRRRTTPDMTPEEARASLDETIRVGVWHPGNDGQGSGLDQDATDGKGPAYVNQPWRPVGVTEREPRIDEELDPLYAIGQAPPPPNAALVSTGPDASDQAWRQTEAAPPEANGYIVSTDEHGVTHRVPISVEIQGIGNAVGLQQARTLNAAGCAHAVIGLHGICTACGEPVGERP